MPYVHEVADATAHAEEWARSTWQAWRAYHGLGQVWVERAQQELGGGVQPAEPVHDCLDDRADPDGKEDRPQADLPA